MANDWGGEDPAVGGGRSSHPREEASSVLLWRQTGACWQTEEERPRVEVDERGSVKAGGWRTLPQRPPFQASNATQPYSAKVCFCSPLLPGLRSRLRRDGQGSKTLAVTGEVVWSGLNADCVVRERSVQISEDHLATLDQSPIYQGGARDLLGLRESPYSIPEAHPPKLPATLVHPQHRGPGDALLRSRETSTCLLLLFFFCQSTR